MQALQNKKLCVYCGSRTGTTAIHVEHATALGVELAKQGITLVYGGGSVGLMGALSDAVINAGGQAIGVIPTHLYEKEIGHSGLQTLEVVPDMHVRKSRMIELADAIIALPGGVGTLEELTEAMTWRQLGLHDKPLGVVDSGGYYSDLFAVLEGMVDCGFADLDLLSSLKRFESPTDLVHAWSGGEWQ
ncbi:MAG: TIGR00730 family Rossman fold protein [Pseudomonadota bacterium]